MTPSSGQEGPESAVTPGATPRLHTRALAILRRRIGSGALPAGSRLLESPLAQEFGVSRAPVRQALLALAAEGRIRRSDGRGFIVEDIGGSPPPGETEEAGEMALTSRPSWQPIHDAVEKAIIERISVASWRIVEVDLARHFGVSRTVAREVMARLHQRGLVKRDDRGRWYAPALTAGYISELYELRWTLEPLALAGASRRAPRSLIVRMRQNLSSAMERAPSLSGVELDALESELHVELLGHCGNATLIEALRLYQSLLVAHTFLYEVSSTHFPSEPFLPEHMAVFDRLLADDIAGASQAMSDHLRAARDRAIARVGIVSRELSVANLAYMHRLG
jgi:DNA-binding GntR family transcriptional regulator